MLYRLLHTAATVRGGNVRGEPWKCGVWSVTGRASSWAARDGGGAGTEHISGTLVGKFSGVFQKHDVWGLGEASASMGTHFQMQSAWDGILVLWSKEDSTFTGTSEPSRDEVMELEVRWPCCMWSAASCGAGRTQIRPKRGMYTRVGLLFTRIF